MMIEGALNGFNNFDADNYFKTADELLNKKQNLSAMLSMMEYMLSTGEKPLEQIRAIGAKTNTDTLLNDFLYALNTPTSQEDAEQN